MAYTPIWDGPGGSLGSLGPNSMRSSMPSTQQHHSGQLSSRLDQQLSCAICLERYEEPRILKCSHSFCRRCLVQVLQRRSDDPQRKSLFEKACAFLYTLYCTFCVCL